ncbi:hypothetical protein HALDL1_13780 [Halobacterium sp. DL1]|nr:hypothetical protein HALDL1_13780 [Halobacterium sp. DL1]
MATTAFTPSLKLLIGGSIAVYRVLWDAHGDTGDP